MKKIIAVLMAFVGSHIAANAQENEALKKVESDTLKKGSSMAIYTINRSGSSETQPLAWFTHEEKKYYVEARMNFDAKETGGIIVGKTFYFSKHFKVTPKAGILFGMNKLGYDGITTEVNLSGAFGKFGYFSMNQMAFAIGKTNKCFQYCYSQFGYDFTSWFGIDYGAQLFHPTSSGQVWLDQGPQFSFTFGKVYIKPWITFDVTHRIEKYILGIGYAF